MFEVGSRTEPSGWLPLQLYDSVVNCGERGKASNRAADEA